MYVSEDPEKSQKDLVSLKEQRNRTTLAGLGLLHKVGWAIVNYGWALGNESAVVQHHLLPPSIRSAVLE